MSAARIAFFGSSLVSAYWNGAATYYRGILQRLHRMGFLIDFYEPDAFDRQRYRDIADPDWARVIVYPAELEGVQRALTLAQGADILIKASGVGVFDEWLEREISTLSGPRRTTIFWDVDAPSTLERVEHTADDPFRAAIPRFDLVLTYGGGAPVVRGYESLGAQACVPIYNALDPNTHHPVAPVERFRGDVGFLGNRLPDREQRFEEFFLSPARRLAGLHFILGGSGWGDHGGLPANVQLLGHVYTHEHNAFNSSCQAVLNINRNSMAKTGFSPATRIFEAAGAGACIITDAWEGIELFLEPGEEVLCASSGQAVTDLLADLDPGAAQRIGAAARRRIQAQHTYDHRATELRAVLNGYSYPRHRTVMPA